MKRHSLGLGLVAAGAGLAFWATAGHLSPPNVNLISSEAPKSSPTAPGVMPASQTPRSAASAPAAPRTAGLPSVVTTGATDSVATGSWRPVVTVEPQDGAATVVAKRESGKRVSLVRAIQSELKRVGCLSGPVTGEWDGDARSAMGAFLTRMNANLPISQPDDILLTLLLGHRDAVCGTECPAGQALAASGRCLPKAIVASGAEPTGRAGKKSARARDALGVAAATGAPAHDSLARVKVATKPDTPAPVAGPPSAPQTAATGADGASVDTYARAEPLPGRMAIGAPAEPVTRTEPPLASRNVAALPANGTGRGSDPGQAASPGVLVQEPPHPHAEPAVAPRPQAAPGRRPPLPAFYAPVVAPKYGSSGPMIQRRRDAIFSRLQTSSP